MWFAAIGVFLVLATAARTTPIDGELRFTRLVQDGLGAPRESASDLSLAAAWRRGDGNTLFWRLVSLPGNGWRGCAVTSAMVAGVLAVCRHRTVAVVFLFLAAGVGASDTALKRLFDRPRPVALAGQPGFEPIRVLAPVEGASFPSGHAAYYTAAFGFLVWFGQRRIARRGPRLAVVLPAAALISLVGISRVYLGAHWASDVAAGYLLGWIWLRGVQASGWADT